MVISCVGRQRLRGTSGELLNMVGNKSGKKTGKKKVSQLDEEIVDKKKGWS